MRSEIEKNRIRLFHTGFSVIEEPDIRAGRKNADFGQGFYLSDDSEFSKRWARERRGQKTYINEYELDVSGLRIKHLARDGEWYDYIYSNRTGTADLLSDYDVITGPIANDTIYDSLGTTTSGFIKRDQALRLLMIGPVYEQTAIKSEKALQALRFVSATEITSEEIASYRDTVRDEEEKYQQQFVKLLGEMINVSE